MQIMDRREFLKLSGFIGALAALSACQPLPAENQTSHCSILHRQISSASKSRRYAWTPFRPRDLPGETV